MPTRIGKTSIGIEDNIKEHLVDTSLRLEAIYNKEFDSWDEFMEEMMLIVNQAIQDREKSVTSQKE